MGLENQLRIGGSEKDREKDMDMDIEIEIDKDIDMKCCSEEGEERKRMEKYMGKENSNTVLLVVVLVMGVALIFICFAMVAICYRSGPNVFLSLSMSVPLYFGWVNSLRVKLGMDSEFGTILEPKFLTIPNVAQIGDTLCLCLFSV